MPRHFSGLIQKCPECGEKFPICSSCTKSRRYCSPACSSQVRYRKCKADRERHAQTETGRISHRARQQRYRDKKKAALEKKRDGAELPT